METTQRALVRGLSPLLQRIGAFNGKLFTLERQGLCLVNGSASRSVIHCLRHSKPMFARAQPTDRFCSTYRWFWAQQSSFQRRGTSGRSYWGLGSWLRGVWPPLLTAIGSAVSCWWLLWRLCTVALNWLQWLCLNLDLNRLSDRSVWLSLVCCLCLYRHSSICRGFAIDNWWSTSICVNEVGCCSCLLYRSGSLPVIKSAIWTYSLMLEAILALAAKEDRKSGT